MLLQEKRLRGLPLTIKPTDIVPIVNFSWNNSFAIVSDKICIGSIYMFYD
jgi:hypothetical protein